MKGKGILKSTLRLALCVLLVALTSVPMAMGEEPPPDPGRVRPAGDVQPLGADDWSLEVGVEWVENYAGTGLANLPATQPDALGLYNRLGGCGWIRRFAWGNGNAWEQDWKGLNKPGGGTENTWVDAVDLAYFAGHGGSTGFYFGTSSIDDRQLHYSDCRLDWGNLDAEWIAIAACNVLADSHRTDWAWCMNGLHLILSFVTTMADVPHGDWFGRYICQGYNMTQAWFKAADVLQPQGKIARVLAEESYHFYDRPYNHNTSDAMDYATYYWWTHTVGSEPARYVDVSQLNAMPVFQTPPLSLGQAQAKWQNLAGAFGVPTTTVSAQRVAGVQGDGAIWVSTDGQLEMDPSAGLYSYTNQDSLWAQSSGIAALSGPVRKLTQGDAKAIADSFLNSHGLMPGDAQFYEVISDTMTALTTTVGAGGLAVQQVSETNTAWQVIYSRIVTYTPTYTPSGLAISQGPIEFSVVGPGTKLKVYVAPEAITGSSMVKLAQEAVMGGVGGWRTVGQAGGQTMAVQQTVPMLTYGQIGKLFEQLEPTVALSYIPLAFESREILTYTVGYYEHPLGTGQDQLIPVYILNTRYNLADQVVVTSPVYIPANGQYMAPVAVFTPTSGISPTVALGQRFVFEAADASRNLSQLGYDALLSFPLGTGDPDSYLYNWYRDTVADGNRIGTGRVLTYTVGLGQAAHPGMAPVAQTIILQVVDSLSPRPPSISYAAYQLNIAHYETFLPAVQKSSGQ